MRVFLDTNVLVSAVATRGLCADIVREVLSVHQLVVSKQLFRELGRNLRKKLGLTDEIISEFVALLSTDAIIVSSFKMVPVNVADKDDIRILSSALSGNTELFVTGDRELIKLKKMGTMEIISPRMFWERLQTGPVS